jgi:hypothetical protein
VATPDPIAGSNVPLSYSTFTHFLHGGAKIGSIKCLWAVVRYTGTAWEVDAQYDSNELTSGMLTWSGSSLSIAVPPGYGKRSVVLATPLGAGALQVRAEMLSPTSLTVTFVDAAGGTVTTQATTMRCSLFLIGI